MVVIWFPPHIIYFNRSDSIPYGLYIRDFSGDIKVGDIVAYMPTDEIVEGMRERGWIRAGQEPLPFLKYVGALPGETYSTVDHRFLINGLYVGEIFDTDTRGKALPHIFGTFKVPTQEFLPLSSDAHGFDGRYTGCVPMNRIITKVIPLWVVYK